MSEHTKEKHDEAFRRYVTRLETKADKLAEQRKALLGVCKLAATVIAAQHEALQTITNGIAEKAGVKPTLIAIPPLNIINKAIAKATVQEAKALPVAKEKPCETCGDSGIAKEQCDGGVAELYCDCPIGEQKLEAFLKDNPDCRPLRTEAHAVMCSCVDCTETREQQKRAEPAIETAKGGSFGGHKAGKKVEK